MDKVDLPELFRDIRKIIDHRIYEENLDIDEKVCFAASLLIGFILEHDQPSVVLGGVIDHINKGIREWGVAQARINEFKQAVKQAIKEAQEGK